MTGHERVIPGNPALAHIGRHHGDLQGIGHGQKFLAGIGKDDAPSQEHNRFFRFEKHVQRLGDLLLVGSRAKNGQGRIGFSIVFDFRFLDVQRQINENRPGSALKCFGRRVVSTRVRAI